MAIDLTLLASIVQTVVLTLTLLVFIFQFRSQEKAIRESSYQNVMGRYNDYIMSGSSADDALLARLFPAGNKEVRSEDASLIRRLLIAYGILEETYELYSKGWINKETWDQWDAWLKQMCKVPLFCVLHKSSTGMFNKGFQEHVTKIIESGPSDSKESSQTF